MKSLELNTLTLISVLSHETYMSCWHWCSRF